MVGKRILAICGRPQFLSTWASPLAYVSVFMAWWLASPRIALRYQEAKLRCLQTSLRSYTPYLHHILVGTQISPDSQGCDTRWRALGVFLEAGYHILYVGFPFLFFGFVLHDLSWRFLHITTLKKFPIPYTGV